MERTDVVHAVLSYEELDRRITARTPLEHSDSKSGAVMERVTIDGESFVLKRLDRRADWTMRAVGDMYGSTLTLWRRGLLRRLPDCIDQPIVAVATDGDATLVLMRDVARHLVPAGDDPIPLDQHRGFLDHMAAMHAAFWDAGPEIDVVPMTNRYFELSPWMASTERELGSDHIVPRLVGEGWHKLETVAPRAAAVVLPLAWDPCPLVEALADTPTTFVHANWKFGNLGTDDTGRTVLIDWESPGRGVACGELAWYLAINAARLPESKEDAIAAFRAALERHGIDTGPWWQRQLALALLGGLVWFGWEKCLGGDNEELAWWEARAVEGAALLF